MKTNRQKPYKYERLSSEIERLITEVVSYEINDKRVSGKCEVTGIKLTHDYSHCKVYVEITSDDKKDVIDGLKNSVGFVKHIISEQLALRKIPDISFVIDDTKEKMDRINEILEQIK